MARSKEIVIGGEQNCVEIISRYNLPQEHRELLDPTMLARDIFTFYKSSKDDPSVDKLLLIGNNEVPYFEVLILINGEVGISTRELTTPKDQHKLFQAELALWRSPANIEANFMHTGTVYIRYLPKRASSRRVVGMYNPQATYLGTLSK